MIWGAWVRANKGARESFVLCNIAERSVLFSLHNWTSFTHTASGTRVSPKMEKKVNFFERKFSPHAHPSQCRVLFSRHERFPHSLSLQVSRSHESFAFLFWRGEWVQGEALTGWEETFHFTKGRKCGKTFAFHAELTQLRTPALSSSNDFLWTQTDWRRWCKCATRRKTKFSQFLA